MMLLLEKYHVIGDDIVHQVRNKIPLHRQRVFNKLSWDREVPKFIFMLNGFDHWLFVVADINTQCIDIYNSLPRLVALQCILAQINLGNLVIIICFFLVVKETMNSVTTRKNASGKTTL